jgi:hypothetical protein
MLEKINLGKLARINPESQAKERLEREGKRNLI